MSAGTRLLAFFRLDQIAGWKKSIASSGVRVDPATGRLELGFIGANFSPLTEAGGSFGGVTLPTGVAVGPDGVVLVANPRSGEILRTPHPGLFGRDASLDGASLDAASGPGFAPLWPGRSIVDIADASNTDLCEIATIPHPPGPYELVRPRGLAFSSDGDLLVTDEGDEHTPGRLLVYAWPSMAVRHVATIGGAPYDVAVDAIGRIHVADADAATGGRVRRFSRQWVEDEWPGGLGELHQPQHLVVNTEGSIFVIDFVVADNVHRLSRLTDLGRVEPLDDAESAAFWHGNYPAPIQEREGSFYAPGESCIEHGPLLRNVIVDKRGRLPQGPLLIYRAPVGGRHRRGNFVTEALDSETYAFAWHRLVLDADLGDVGALEIRTYTDEHYREPARIDLLPDDSWSTRIVLLADNRPEMLVQSGPGRYLWLKIGLVGDGINTPRISALEMLGPRRSSLRFLPAPFHEDPVSRDFVDRFLSYFDTIFDEIGHRIGRFSAELSPQGAPEGSFLAWLVGWFDIDLLAQWSDDTRREFLRNAMDLHRTRGTIAGLKAVLRLHLGVDPPMPVLIEGFRLRRFSERREIGMADIPAGGMRIGGIPLPEAFVNGDLAHRFLVVVPEAVASNEGARRTLRSLVDRFRPAHTAWELITVKPGIRVGCQSLVGVDTLLGGYPSAPLGEMVLGQSAQITSEHPNTTRIGAARLGTSSLL